MSNSQLTLEQADIALFNGDYETCERLLRSTTSDNDCAQRRDFTLAALMYACGYRNAGLLLGIAQLNALAHGITGTRLTGRELANFLATKSHPEHGSRPSIELVVFTHATKKPAAKPYNIPPSTDLIRATLKSARDHLQSDIKTTVLVDDWGSPDSVSYVNNLHSLAKAENFELKTSNKYGLRQQWLKMASIVQSDFVIIMEHDWLFRSHMATAAQLIEIMQDNPLLNHVRFNKRANICAGWDRMVAPDFLGHRNNVTLTTSFSNSPHIIRTSFLRQVVAPIIGLGSEADVANGGAGGVEMQVIKYRRRLESVIGESFSAMLLGTAILGPLNQSAVVRHIG
jgi:hypothetical protein